MIRLATEKDLDGISELWLAMVKEVAPSYDPQVDWWITIARKMLQIGYYWIYVAEADGQYLGFIDFFVWPEPSTGKIHGVGQHFYVNPIFRNKTVSGELYRRAIKTVKENGATVFELFCMDNEKTFWNKKGYETIRTLVRRG